MPSPCARLDGEPLSHITRSIVTSSAGMRCWAAITDEDLDNLAHLFVMYRNWISAIPWLHSGMRSCTLFSTHGNVLAVIA